LPKPRSGFSAFSIGNKIVLVGGNDGRVLNKVDVYDTKTSKWDKMPSMIMKRDELAVTVGPDNMIYAVGGYGGPDK
jgi:N-acetylneuraminic acid mutarotase